MSVQGKCDVNINSHIFYTHTSNCSFVQVSRGCDEFSLQVLKGTVLYLVSFKIDRQQTQINLKCQYLKSKYSSTQMIVKAIWGIL